MSRYACGTGQWSRCRAARRSRSPERREWLLRCARSGGSLDQALKAGLRPAKNLVDILFGAQLFTQVFGIAFVGQGKLIPQVVKAVVDRRG